MEDLDANKFDLLTTTLSISVPSSISTKKEFHSSLLIAILWIIFIIGVILIGTLFVCLYPTTRPKIICRSRFLTEAPDVTKLDSEPRALAVGDFNHDHIIDIVVAYSKTSQIALLLGSPDGMYQKPTIYSTGDHSEPYSIAVADFNNDTNPDIVVANRQSHSIKIFFADHQGNLNRSIEYSTNVGRPIQVVTDDINNDHHPDIIVLTDGTYEILLFINNDDESFQLSPVTYFMGDDSSPTHFSMADINNDGFVDLIVANSQTNEIAIFLNSFNGQFANPIFHLTGVGSHPFHTVVIDMNADQHLDLVVSEPGYRQIAIFLGLGNGSLKEDRKITTNGSVSSLLAVADMNQDGLFDLIFFDESLHSIQMYFQRDNGEYSFGWEYPIILAAMPTDLLIDDLNNDHRSDIIISHMGTNYLKFLYGTDAVKFQSPIHLMTSDAISASAIRSIDFNNDHYQDLVVLTNNATLFVFYGDNQGRFASPVNYSLNREPFPVTEFTIQDINADNRLDLIISGLYMRGLHIFLQSANGSFPTMSHFVPENVPFYGSRLFHFVDINHDQLIDLVMFNGFDNAVGVSLATDHGIFPQLFTLSVCSEGSIVNTLLVDIDNDGETDILIANQYVGIQILFGDGKGHFTNEIIYTSDNAYGIRHLSVIDLNDDGYLDIIALYYQSTLIEIWLGNLNRAFNKEASYPLSDIQFGAEVNLNDINGDSHIDIIITNYNQDRLRILTGYGNGSFAQEMIIFVPRNFTDIVVEDFDNDHRADIATVLQNNPIIDIMFSDDSGAIVEKLTMGTGSGQHPSAILTGDFDRDGEVDLVMMNMGTASLTFRFGSGNYTFDREVFYSSERGNDPQAMVMGDFNYDNNIDLIIANIGSSSLQVLLGSNNGTFIEENIYSLGLGSRPSSLIAADFDQDKWLDVATYDSRAGMIRIFHGYQYSSFIDHKLYKTDGRYRPQTLVTGDFNGDRYKDILAIDFVRNMIDLYFGDKSGDMVRQMNFTLNGSLIPLALALDDFNENDQLDLLVIDGAHPYIRLFLDFDPFNPKKPLVIDSDLTRSDLQQPLILDVNNDHHLDLIITINSMNVMYTFLGFGNGSFARPIMCTFPDQYELAWQVNGHFNNDSYPDFVLQDPIGNKMSIFLGNGNSTYSLASTYLINDTSDQFMTVGDFNEDNATDVILINRRSSSVDIYFGTNQGSLIYSKSYTNDLIHGAFLNSINTADFNQDGHFDLIIAAKKVTSYVMVIFGDGKGNFYREISHSLYPFSYIDHLLISDINDDNYYDVITTMGSLFSFTVIMNSCCILLGNPLVIPTNPGTHDTRLSTGDIDGDNRTDLIVPNPKTASITIHLNSIDYSFSSQIILPIDSDSRILFAVSSDINHDEYQDLILVLDGTDNLIIFLGNGSKSLKKFRSYSIGSNTQLKQLIVEDMNNDGFRDLAWTDVVNSRIGVMLGDGHGNFDSIVSFPTGYNSGPSDLTTVRFNNSDQMNLVAVLMEANTFGFTLQTCHDST